MGSIAYPSGQLRDVAALAIPAHFMQNCCGRWGVTMSTRSWGDLWNLLITLMSREPIFVQIMFWLGLAFLAVMVLEGLRSSFAPKRAIDITPKTPSEFSEKPITLAEAKMHVRPTVREELPQDTFTISQHQINRPRAFRSTARKMRVLGVSKSSS
jgi:hypothetical protein